MAIDAVAHHGVGIALACRTFQISETCYRYSPMLSDENEEIADWLERLTANKRSWGFGLCFLYLRNVQGYGWNHKRVYRIYCELELNGLSGTSRNHWQCLTGRTRLGRWISWQISLPTVVRSGR